MFYYNNCGGPYYAADRPIEPQPEPEGTLDPESWEVQDGFIKAKKNVDDFLGFLRELYPDAIKDYLDRSEEPFKDYCGVK